MTVRAPSIDEAAALAELLNAHSRALHGADDLAPETMRTWFGAPELEMLVVDGPDGLEAYADFVPASGDENAWIDLRPRPGHAEAADALLAAFEGRSRELGRTGVRVQVADEDEFVRSLVERRGYVPIRHQFRMAIELPDEPAAPALPEGIEIRLVREGEEAGVHAAQMEAFADTWAFQETSYETWRGWNVEREGSRLDLWWVAVDGDEIAGLCLNRGGDTGEPGHAYVHILGVRPRWRRRGVGLALLAHAFGELHRHGYRRVTLDVDGDSTTGAVQLYERAGMHVERQAAIYELRLDG